MKCSKCKCVKMEEDFILNDKFKKTCNNCRKVKLDKTYNVLGIAGCFNMIEIKKALQGLKIDLIDHNMVDLTKENYDKFINDYNTQNINMDIDTQTFVSGYKPP